MKKHALAVAVAASLGASAGIANAASISSMTVTGGSFGMGFFTGGGFIPFSGVGSSNDLASFSTFSGNNTVQATGSGGTCAAGTVACFDFGAAQVNAFLAAGSAQLGDGNTRPNLAGQTFDENNGTSTVDLSGFYANWNTTDFNQGNAAVTLTTSNCAGGSCDYTASWTSFIMGGPFDGNTGSWKISGTVSAVPVPAAAWLMGSGLVGLVGVARRRKAK